MKQLNTSFLDGTRILLALWVAVGHFYKYIGGKNLVDIPVLSDVILTNSAAVDGFMLITGFLMMYHYLLREQREPATSRETILKFYLRRLFRIYPLYVLAVIVAFLLFPISYGYIYENYEFFTGKAAHFNTTYSPDAVPTFVDLFSHLTFLHGLIPTQNVSVLGPAWSLSLEMQFYLLFPFIFLLMFRKGNIANKSLLALTIFSIIVSTLSKKLLGVWDSPGEMMSFGAPSILSYSIHLFILGMIMASVALKKASPIHIFIWLLLAVPFQHILSSVLILAIVILMFSEMFKKFIPKSVYSLINIVKINVLSNKVAKLGADLSYSLYLIHMIIMPMVVNAITKYTDLGIYTTATIALIAFLIVNLSISYGIYLWVEKPGITFGKNFIKQKFDKNKSVESVSQNLVS
ncbi:MAG: acyltransferase family protein [Bacillota bacterium]